MEPKGKQIAHNEIDPWNIYLLDYVFVLYQWSKSTTSVSFKLIKILNQCKDGLAPFHLKLSFP